VSARPGRPGDGPIGVGAEGSHRCGQEGTAVVVAGVMATVVVGWTAPVAPPHPAPITASAPVASDAHHAALEPVRSVAPLPVVLRRGEVLTL
jgi:hypothetical protein